MSIEQEITKDIENTPVLVFIKGDREQPRCGFSAKLMKLLDELKVKYETRNVMISDQYKETVKQVTGWPTFPQLFVNGKLIGGCDIAFELHQTGELEKILQ
jgi:monothiol glutaredoxin